MYTRVCRNKELYLKLESNLRLIMLCIIRRKLRTYTNQKDQQLWTMTVGGKAKNIKAQSTSGKIIKIMVKFIS